MMAHSDSPALLRPSKTTTAFRSVVPSRTRSEHKRSSRCGHTVAAGTAVRSRNPVLQPREENVTGEFYVDQTCIGNLLVRGKRKRATPVTFYLQLPCLSNIRRVKLS